MEDQENEVETGGLDLAGYAECLLETGMSEVCMENVLIGDGHVGCMHGKCFTTFYKAFSCPPEILLNFPRERFPAQSVD